MSKVGTLPHYILSRSHRGRRKITALFYKITVISEPKGHASLQILCASNLSLAMDAAMTPHLQIGLGPSHLLPSLL